MNEQKTDKKCQSRQAEHEIAHSKRLASVDTEFVWGWGTPAGKIRAKRRGELIISFSEMDSKSRILEIGCGTGLFTEMFSKTGAEIIAVDISPELILEAKKRNFPAGNVQLVCQRFEDIQNIETFDAIVGSSVLHHLDIEKALSVIFKLLKSGGRFAFAEPNMLNPQVFAVLTFLRKHLSFVSPDETAFIRWQFNKLLKAFRFEDVKIVPFDWLHPFTPKQFIPQINRLGQFLEKIPGIREFSGSLVITGRRPF
jgi:2-polyprenyl-3-methyl-5-hydroxy-6-metoxy-1,4-benzoquinol methylase